MAKVSAYYAAAYAGDKIGVDRVRMQMHSQRMFTADQFKQWRAAQRLTREQAALRMGVSMATYIRWETGKRQPSTLASLAAVKRELALDGAGVVESGQATTTDNN